MLASFLTFMPISEDLPHERLSRSCKRTHGKSISLLDQFNLLHINDSIPQIANYAMFLTEQQEPERGISELQKLSGIIKEYHSDECLDYAKVQENLATIYLMTANLSQAKTHFKKAFKIYEKIWLMSLK